MLVSAASSLPISSPFGLFVTSVISVFAVHIFYRLYWHPLAKFRGPWYSSCFSLSVAVINVLRLEPQWLESLVKKYGANSPIRILPDMLLFPRPSSLNDIYWDPKCNQKSGLYGTGVLGPPHLFTTLDGDAHRALRKAVGGQQWTIGSLKNNWESRIDDQVQLLCHKLNKQAEKCCTVCLSDRMAEFSADIITMLSFTYPFGFIQNSRDEHRILTNWREGLPFFGFAGRFKFFRKYILNYSGLSYFIMPKTTDPNGIGWLIAEATRQVSEREQEIQQGTLPKKDYLQYCLDARMNGKPLSAEQKIAHVTLLIQAGSDTTGTGLGSTLRFLLTNPDKMAKALEELDAADRAGLLSNPVKYDETDRHLPYFVACIKESLRLQPPALNLFPRIVGKEGKVINGYFVPPGTEVTSHAHIVHRDPILYAPDPNGFRPERWLEQNSKVDSTGFVFGIGPRVCIGKDIALMEMYKLLPELLRRFDFHLVSPGEHILAGGLSYNRDFVVTLKKRW